MSRIHIQGGYPLNGKVEISGAKNAALPILAASLLAADGESTLAPVPMLNDVVVMLDLLQTLGAQIDTDGAEKVFINAQELTGYEAPYDLVNKMRASILIMGPLLARLGRARVALPGGCAIGSRPVDLHLRGFAALGAEISQGHGFVEAKAARLRGSHICLDYPSVGATENIMTTAVLAEGMTVIENAAAEPEIVNLAAYLNGMGGCVSGAGTDRVEIRGVKSLQGAEQKIIPDRIEVGTYLIAAMLGRGQVSVSPVDCSHLTAVLSKLMEAGADIVQDKDELTVRSVSGLRPVDVRTQPYPGFPTDMQPQTMALLTQVAGVSLITETVFENRFMHVPELCRMGAQIRVSGRQAIVQGATQLTGAPVVATDLRAGAALILAGLVAQGETAIGEAFHIDRGYVRIVDKLSALGAKIERRP